MYKIYIFLINIFIGLIEFFIFCCIVGFFVIFLSCFNLLVECSIFLYLFEVFDFIKFIVWSVRFKIDIMCLGGFFYDFMGGVFVVINILKFLFKKR